MTDFKAKMHQIRFRLGLRPAQTPLVGAPPDPLAGFKGPTSKGRGGRGGVGEGKGRNGKGIHRPRSVPPYFLLRIYAHGGIHVFI